MACVSLGRWQSGGWGLIGAKVREEVKANESQGQTPVMMASSFC